MRHEPHSKVNPRLARLLEARSHDPFGVLGSHRHGSAYTVRVFEPRAERAWLDCNGEWREMQAEGEGLFCTSSPIPVHAYRVRWSRRSRAWSPNDAAGLTSCALCLMRRWDECVS